MAREWDMLDNLGDSFHQDDLPDTCPECGHDGWMKMKGGSLSSDDDATWQCEGCGHEPFTKQGSPINPDYHKMESDPDYHWPVDVHQLRNAPVGHTVRGEPDPDPNHPSDQPQYDFNDWSPIKQPDGTWKDRLDGGTYTSEELHDMLKSEPGLRNLRLEKD